MKQLKIFGVPVASFGDAPAKNSDAINNVAQVGSLPDPSPVPGRQTKFLSPRYEPSNITQNADVQRIQIAIRQAENGDTQELFRFYRDILLGDDHIQGCFNTRKLALLAQPLNILPEDKNNPDDVALAAAMNQARRDCENWHYGMLALMDSNGFWPNSIVERLYKPAGQKGSLSSSSSSSSVPKPLDGGGRQSAATPKLPPLQYTLRKFIHVNPQLHCYQWAYLMGGVGLGTGSAIQLSQMAGASGTAGNPYGSAIDGTAAPDSPYRIDLERWEPYLKLWPIDVAGRIVYDVTRASYLDPARHIIHRGHLMQSFRDNWGGPARAILMWWLFRNLGREWFARGMERVGTPFPVGYTDANDPQAVALLREAFDLAKTIGGLVVDESSRIELKEAMVAGMAQGYETFYSMCNEAISFHITGMRQSQKPGGLNSGEDSFISGVREDVRMYDQMMLGETCVNQIAIPFRDINGLQGNVKFVWGGLSDDDAVKFAGMINTMGQANLEVADESLSIVNERTGLTWQRKAAPAPLGNGKEDGGLKMADGKDDDDPPAHGDDAANGTKPSALSSINYPLSSPRWLSASNAPSPIDSIVRDHEAALARAFRGALAPVRQIILSSASQKEAEHKLTALFADWPHERIAGLVEQAMQICAARGCAGAAGTGADDRR